MTPVPELAKPCYSFGALEANTRAALAATKTAPQSAPSAQNFILRLVIFVVKKLRGCDSFSEVIL
jgi:hypothetical protein